MNVSYLQKNGRVYKLGNRLIEIHNDVVNNLLQWNEDPQRNDQDIDYAFGLSLLLSLISIEDISVGRIDNNALTFVQGMHFIVYKCCRLLLFSKILKDNDFFLELLRIRAMSNEKRVENATVLIRKYCDEKRERQL